ncbi:MAG: YqjK-like protein [Pseudomonadota bacterium]|jgi:hypothetical protein
MRRIEVLARRRIELVARSARLRNDLALEAVRIGGQLGVLDKGFALARSFTRQPLLLAGAAAALFYLRPLRAMKWVARGAVLFSIGRRIFSAMGRGAAEREDPPTFV